MNDNKIRTVTELYSLSSYEDRLRYLKLDGKVGYDTFGFDRVFNQMLYNSTEWRRRRTDIIIRDNGLDLGSNGHEIPDGVSIFIHHMNPATMEDFRNRPDILLDPEYLITTTFDTHNFIHYGRTGNRLPSAYSDRSKNDTCPWRR